MIKSNIKSSKDYNNPPNTTKHPTRQQVMQYNFFEIFWRYAELLEVIVECCSELLRVFIGNSG